MADPGPTFKQETVVKILQSSFTDDKTKIQGEAAKLMVELTRLFATEAAVRCARRAKSEDSPVVSVEHFEKALPQLIMEEDTIRPQIDVPLAPELLERYYGMTAVSTKELKSHEDRNFHMICGSAPNPEEYVLKIVRCDGEYQEKKNAVLNSLTYSQALQNSAFVCSAPVPCLNLKMVQEHTMNDLETVPLQKIAMCLLHYIPGTLLYDMVPLSHQVLFELGTVLGEMHIAVKSLDMPGMEEKQADNEWNLENAVQLEKYLVHLNCEKKFNLVKTVLNNFKTHLLPNMEHLEKGIIHGDLNDENIVLIDHGSCGEQFRKKLYKETHLSYATSNPKLNYGILDFIDVCYSAYIFDLATSVAFFMMSASVENFIGHVGHFIAGYTQRKPLKTVERNILFYAVCCAYSRELVLCEYHYQLQNKSNDYLLTSSKNGWEQLTKICALGKTFVDAEWDNIVAQYI